MRNRLFTLGVVAVAALLATSAFAQVDRVLGNHQLRCWRETGFGPPFPVPCITHNFSGKVVGEGLRAKRYFDLPELASRVDV